MAGPSRLQVYHLVHTSPVYTFYHIAQLVSQTKAQFLDYRSHVSHMMFTWRQLLLPTPYMSRLCIKDTSVDMDRDTLSESCRIL